MQRSLLIISCLIALASPIHAQDRSTDVLLFTKTAAFRHSSIPSGVEAMWILARENDWNITATEDASFFNAESLSGFDVVVWLNTTGDVLNEEQQLAFRQYYESGKGYVGIHAAADTEHDWPWYGSLLGGAWFKSHPPTQLGTLIVEDSDHPAMDIFSTMSMQTWTSVDEWYSHKANPRDYVNVLLSLEESSIMNLGGSTPANVLMQGDHPMAWYHELGGGRAFYTNRGHTHESFQDPVLLEHFRGAIEWAGGKIE